MDEVQQLAHLCIDTRTIDRIEYRGLLAAAFDVDVLACDEAALRSLAQRELSGLSPVVLGDVEGVLRGETLDGVPIEGGDSVRIVPCR